VIPDKVYQYVKLHIESGAYNLSGNELYMECPDCGDETHFSVNLTNGFYNCFKCPNGGRLSSVIVNNRSEWKKLTHNLMTKDFIGNKKTGNIVLPKNAFNVYDVLYPSKTKPRKKHISNSLSLCGRAFSYCIGRGLSVEQIRDYDVYVCPGDPRVYFPYWDKTGKVVYYMGRKMMGDDNVEKTKDAENSEKPLFGRHVTVLTDSVILVEGVFDHFVTPNSYALMGSSINVEQVLQLRKDDVKRVFVLGDPDASEKAYIMAKKLRSFRFKAFPVYLHTNGDPGKMGREKMVNMAENLLSVNRKIFEPIHLTIV